VLSIALFPRLGHIGVGLAISLAGWTTAGVLAWLIARRIGFSLDSDARRRLPRIVVASLAMGVVLAFAWMQAEPWLAGRGSLVHGSVLLVLVVCGLASYGVGLHLLGVTDIGGLIRAARRAS
jgi:putative peptidoglycan lipid II flippase